MFGLLINGRAAGEIRSSLAPCKPHRTPSVRDASSASTVSDGDGGYESVELEPGPASSGSSDRYL